MYQITCPYCSNPLVNDGTFAGQVVQCPRCGGQMQMPGMAAPPVPPPIAPTTSGFELTSAGTSVRTSYRPSRRQSGANPVVFWGAVIFLASTVVFAAVFIASDINSGPTKASAYSNGYRYGHMGGKSSRNTGSPFSPGSDFQELELMVRVRHHEEFKNDPYASAPLPELGTSEYGDFREGFYAGYQDGFAGK